MAAERYDIIIVGGGTSGTFAAATAANEGLSVVILERKSREDGGMIACGDAIKGKSTFPDVIDREYLRAESFTNENILKARFENPLTDSHLDIPFRAPGAVVDRKRYGEVLLEEAERAGAEIHWDTVVRDVIQNDSGRVTGVTTTRKGNVKNYEAEVVIDAAGSLSLLQDKVDFSNTTFDTKVSYSQFCSAYREVLITKEPVDYHDAIVFKPTEELGYLWYFPRSPTEINVGLGFQMNKPPMKLVEVLKNDIRSRPEFDGAKIKNKLGAALPTRRPYDSATANGYIAVGDAAGHVNPTTGGGIPGAAKAGHWAALEAIKAISEGDVTESNLWNYNQRVMQDFGKRFAAMDIYNIFGGAHDVNELVKVISALPGQQLLDTLGKEGNASMSFGLKVKTALKTFGHWDVLYELYKVQKKANELRDVYDQYPDDPSGFESWRESRDAVMDDVYRITGATPKY
ncbi:geranylgeranyl reductase family protein [Haladaptatus sp. DJG-WS-42]|uniref:geranylgeranyl reductase family protein n=1 Tax=Haladaptatus sp. DJG-WS-42 TaxID=3120516 RepID=UPI0030CB2BA2